MRPLPLLTFFAVIGYAALFQATSLQAQSSDERPNILFISIDDLRPELACYGVEGMHSPNIDKFAESGVLFEKHYVQMAVCIPSRVALLTSLRSERTQQVYGPNKWKDIEGVQTLGQVFTDAGYYTAAIGKIWHTLERGKNDKFDLERNSYEDRFLYPENVRLNDEYNKIVREARSKGKKKPQLPFDQLPGITENPDVEDSAYNDGQTCDKAIEVLKKCAKMDRSFMLAVGFKKPHLPFNAPKKYWDLYREEDMPLAKNQNYPKGMPKIAFNHNPNMEMYSYGDYPPYDIENKTIDDRTARHLIHAYRAATSFADAQVGRLLDELDRLGLEENTIVILWSDHGFHLGESGMWSKHSNFEAAAHSPLIIRAPGWTSPGGRSEALVETVDLIPTMLDYCGLPPMPITDGKSLQPLLRDPAEEGDGAAFHVYNRWGGRIGYAVRTDRYRLVSWRQGWSIYNEEIALELYDYETDPYETVNQADNPDYANEVKRLRKLLEEGPAGQFSERS